MMRIAAGSILVMLAKAQSNEMDEFESFKSKFMKVYATAEEEQYRFGVFKTGLVRIAERNADPDDHAQYGVTRWADMSDAERHLKCGGSKWSANRTRVDLSASVAHQWDGTCYASKRFPDQCTAAIPDSFDWTASGAVGPIKDQGKCGNCFTFGETGDAENAWFLAGEELASLSEQQITSCDRVGDDSGCGGGWSNLDTDKYITSVKGLASEKAYPYCSGTYGCKGSSKKQKKNGVCNKALEAKPVAFFNNGYQVSGGPTDCSWCTKNTPVDETQMKKHLFTAGTVTIAINSQYFDDYKSGIMSPKASKCKGDLNSLDHQVMIVGYGSENGVDYWKIKNSWGTDWGEAGFCRIVRGSNRCGVASDASHIVANAPSKVTIV